jgi:hypothetical protein
MELAQESSVGSTVVIDDGQTIPWPQKGQVKDRKASINYGNQESWLTAFRERTHGLV